MCINPNPMFSIACAYNYVVINLFVMASLRSKYKLMLKWK